MAPKIFISYRRQDAQAAAGRIFDHLSASFAKPDVFMDVDSIEPGADFVALLEERMSQCEALIAVIGPNWTDVTDRDGNRHLNGRNDYVRLEIESALKRNILVVPVLVDGARMPDEANLPDPLKPLARRNAAEVSHHRFHDDTEKLSRFLAKALGLDRAGGQAPSEPEPDMASNALAADGTPSWANTLLSFRGRISRKQFWLWAIVLTLVSVVLQYLTLLLAGEPAGKFLTDGHAISPGGKLLMQLCVLPLWWMAFALIAKRIHDFGQGWGLLTFVVVLTVVFLIIDLLAGAALKAFPNPEDHPGAVGVLLLQFALSIVFIALLAAIGLLRGHTGPNEYGPDPKRLS